MQFKRQEPFRFVFNEPIEANYVLISEDGQASDDKMSHSCKILDLSPRGIKIYTDAKIGEYENQPFQIEIQFILDISTIRARGEMVWSRPFGTGKQYGIQIEDQPDIMDLIISEMKQRRRKEVFTKKSG